jgi:hypothetical protein
MRSMTLATMGSSAGWARGVRGCDRDCPYPRRTTPRTRRTANRGPRLLDVDVHHPATDDAAARPEAPPRRARPAWSSQVRHGGPMARRLRPGVVGGVVVLVIVYAGLAAAVAGGAAAWTGDTPTALVAAAAGGGALVGALGAADWVRRRWRHASFDLVRRPGPLWVWDGDPTGAGFAWWLPWVVLGPFVATVGIVARAVATAAQRGERRVVATVLALAAVLAALAGLLGAVAASGSGETVRGALLGVGLVASAVGAAPAWRRARRFAIRLWPPSPLVAGGQAGATRRRGGVVPLPPGIRHRSSDPHGAAAAAVAIVVAAAVSGWAFGVPDDDTITVAAPPTSASTTATTAPVVTTAAPSAPVVAAVAPLEGFGLWCHVLEVMATTDTVLDPAAFTLHGPDGQTIEPFDVSELETREPAEAVDVAGGTTARAEVCFALDADAPTGRWQLVVTVGDTAVTIAVTR